MGRVLEPIARSTYNDTFKRSASALRDADIPHACMGSLALWALGGPEPNLQQDLDFAVAEEDADAAREALAGAGLTLQEPPEGWLFKAWSHGVEEPGSALVDVIFRPSGLVITRERLLACEHRSVLAVTVPVIGATDLLVTKLHSLTEQCADYSSTLQFVRSLREQVDRADLESRVRDTPFGAAFLVLVDALGIGPQGSGQVHVGRGGKRAEPQKRRLVEQPVANMIARLEQLIHEDSRSSTLDVKVTSGNGCIVLKGEAANEHHRDEVTDVVHDLVPGVRVDNRMEVREYERPSDDAEAIG
jgi:hypothetical protein